MRFVYWFLISLLASLALIFGGSVLLVSGTIAVPAFVSMVCFSVALLLIPLFFIGKGSITQSYAGITIKGPCLDVFIEYSKIQAVEKRESFQTGIRVFGYGGLKLRSGDFSNKEFGKYKFYGRMDVPLFIVVRCDDKIVVFNDKDVQSTSMLYDLLVSRSHSFGTVTMTQEERQKNAFDYSRIAKMVVVFSVILAIGIVVFVMFIISAGHVNVSLDDTGINIDASMADQHINYSDIATVEYRDGFDKGSRIGGYSSLDIDSGTYRNNEFGKYKLAIHSKVPAYIVIGLKDGSHSVFNMDGVDATKTMCQDIKDRVGLSTSAVFTGSPLPA